MGDGRSSTRLARGIVRTGLAMAVALTEGEGDERFEFGLDLLLRGIASTVK